MREVLKSQTVSIGRKGMSSTTNYELFCFGCEMCGEKHDSLQFGRRRFFLYSFHLSRSQMHAGILMIRRPDNLNHNLTESLFRM